MDTDYAGDWCAPAIAAHIGSTMLVNQWTSEDGMPWAQALNGLRGVQAQLEQPAAQTGDDPLAFAAAIVLHLIDQADRELAGSAVVASWDRWRYKTVIYELLKSGVIGSVTAGNTQPHQGTATADQRLPWSIAKRQLWNLSAEPQARQHLATLMSKAMRPASEQAGWPASPLFLNQRTLLLAARAGCITTVDLAGGVAQATGHIKALLGNPCRPHGGELALLDHFKLPSELFRFELEAILLRALQEKRGGKVAVQKEDQRGTTPCPRQQQWQTPDPGLEPEMEPEPAVDVAEDTEVSTMTRVHKLTGQQEPERSLRLELLQCFKKGGKKQQLIAGVRLVAGYLRPGDVLAATSDQADSPGPVLLGPVASIQLDGEILEEATEGMEFAVSVGDGKKGCPAKFGVAFTLEADLVLAPPSLLSNTVAACHTAGGSSKKQQRVQEMKTKKRQQQQQQQHAPSRSQAPPVVPVDPELMVGIAMRLPPGEWDLPLDQLEAYVAALRGAPQRTGHLADDLAHHFGLSPTTAPRRRRSTTGDWLESLQQLAAGQKAATMEPATVVEQIVPDLVPPVVGSLFVRALLRNPRRYFTPAIDAAELLRFESPFSELLQADILRALLKLATTDRRVCRSAARRLLESGSALLPPEVPSGAWNAAADALMSTKGDAAAAAAELAASGLVAQWPAWTALTTPSPSGSGSDSEPTLTLPTAVRVELVEDKVALQRCMEELAAEPAIGIDAEWPPGAPGPATVLQLAGRQCVYIVDLPNLAVLCGAKLADALSALLRDESTLKVGYGFANSDLPRLAALDAAYDLRGASLCHARAVVDLGRAESQLVQGKLISGGLNSLVRARLGCHLDKSEQCSAWGRRPLSAAQLHYAALDAYVALLLYDRIVAEPNGVAALEAATTNPAIEGKSKVMADELDGALLGRTGSAGGTTIVAACAAFDRLDIRVATVVTVAPIAMAHTLLCLTVEMPAVSLGASEEIQQTERKQVVSGLAKEYTPAELLQRPVLVICNVAPREICGLRSEAGLLCAYYGTSPEHRELVRPAATAQPGEPLRISTTAEATSDPDAALRAPTGPPDLLIDLSAGLAAEGGAANAWEDCAAMLAVARDTGALLLNGVELRTVGGTCSVGSEAAAEGCSFR
jgi:tRNA-binding EMAP/Myf-like protein